MLNNEFTFSIEEHIGVLSTNQNGWQRELNRVSWNGNEAKYDLRDWNSSHDRMSRGITLSTQDFMSLVNVIKDRY